jgi:V8-like Glu-specific endopeptidase
MPDPNDPPIIITGGSVYLDFDASTLPGSSGKHSNAGKKIRHVTVVIDGSTVYDDDTPNGKVEISVIYGNP